MEINYYPHPLQLQSCCKAGMVATHAIDREIQMTVSYSTNSWTLHTLFKQA